MKDGIQLNKERSWEASHGAGWRKCPGPRELVCECTRALAGLSEGGHVYLRMSGQYCVGVGTLWSWYTHVCGCKGVGRVAEVHTNSCVRHNLFQTRCRASVCANMISRFTPVTTTPENSIKFTFDSQKQRPKWSKRFRLRLLHSTPASSFPRDDGDSLSPLLMWEGSGYSLYD